MALPVDVPVELPLNQAVPPRRDDRLGPAGPRSPQAGVGIVDDHLEQPLPHALAPPAAEPAVVLGDPSPLAPLAREQRPGTPTIRSDGLYSNRAIREKGNGISDKPGLTNH